MSVPWPSWADSPSGLGRQSDPPDSGPHHAGAHRSTRARRPSHHSAAPLPRLLVAVGGLVVFRGALVRIDIPAWVPKTGLVRRLVQAVLRALMTASERIEYDLGQGPGGIGR
jgi:hypothetical protein